MDSSFYESDNVTQGKFYCIRNGFHLSYSFIRIPSIKWSCALVFFIAFTRSAEDFMFAIKSFTVLYWWWFKRVRPRQIYSRYFLIQVNRLSNLPGCQMPGWFCRFIFRVNVYFDYTCIVLLFAPQCTCSRPSSDRSPLYIVI